MTKLPTTDQQKDAADDAAFFFPEKGETFDELYGTADRKFPLEHPQIAPDFDAGEAPPGSGEEVQVAGPWSSVFKAFKKPDVPKIDAGATPDVPGAKGPDGAVTPTSGAPTLPYGHQSYFNMTDDTIIMSLDNITSLKSPQDKGVARAGEYMEKARVGEFGKRDPIQISDNGDGTFTIVDGNATFHQAQKNGWQDIPVEIVNGVDEGITGSGVKDLKIEGGQVVGDGPPLKVGDDVAEGGDVREIELPRVHADDIKQLANRNFRQELGNDIEFKGLTDFNVAHLEAGGSVKEMIEFVSRKYADDILEKTNPSKGFVARRTQQATRATANLIGGNYNKMLANLFDGKVDIKNLDAHAVATRDLLVWAGSHADAAIERAIKSDTGENLLEAEKALVLHAKIQAEVKGVQTEIARALNSYKIPASTSPNRAAKLEELIQLKGGRDSMLLRIKAYQNLPDNASRAKFSREIQGSKTWNAVYEVWINALLSSFQTVGLTGVNVISNIATTFGQIPTKFVAAGFGAMRRAKTGATDGVRFGEATSYGMEMFTSMFEAVKLSGITFKNGTKPDWLLGTKIDNGAYRPKAFSADAFEKGGVLGKVIDIAGNIATMGRYPTRLLDAGDTFFKVMAYRGELGALAKRKALEAGGDAKTFAANYAEHLQNPSKETMQEGAELGRYVTLQTELGRYGKAVQGMTRHPILKWFVPFTRTPLNSMNRFIDHSPFALLTSNYDAAVKKGGAQADMARARVAMGSSVMAVTGVLASMGHITGGGPKDPELRRNWLASGWRPYSIRVGTNDDGKPIYAQYKRMDPIATVLGVAADMAEMTMHLGDVGKRVFGPDQADMNDEWAEILTMAGLAISKNVTSRTYMEGFSQLIDLIDKPETKGGAMWLNGFISSWVPRVVKNAADTMDNSEIKHVRTLMEALQAQVPGWSSSLHAKRDHWGRKRETYKSDIGANMYNPYYLSTYDPSPADEEMVRLKVEVQLPSEHIAVGPKGNQKQLDLAPDEYDFYAKRVGEIAFESVNKLVQTDKYKNRNKFTKEIWIKGAFQIARIKAQQELHKKFPHIMRIKQNVYKALMQTLKESPEK